jgi:hypothetical protein
MAANTEKRDPDRDTKSAPDRAFDHPTGPTSIDGVEARDLPDGGRGGPDTDQHHEHARKLPQQTGQNTTGDVGLRGTPDIADASDHGNRKHN